MDPQRIMGQLSPQDRGFLREVELRTGEVFCEIVSIAIGKQVTLFDADDRW